VKIAFTYNLKPKKIIRGSSESELYADFDTPETIKAIKKAIKNNGYEVIMIEANELAYNKLRKNRDKIDLVFNFAEAVTDTADREAQIPMFCEILRIPYTGPGPLSAALILNKARAKQIWHHYGIATPKFQWFFSGEEKIGPELKFPMIVKTNEEGSSAGVRDKSLVKNETELRSLIKELQIKFKSAVLVENFLPGKEFTVGVLGNDGYLETLPIVETNFEALPDGVNHIDSYEAKWIWDDPNNPIEAMYCPAKINKETEEKIKLLAKRAFEAIGCRDWGRVDIRMDEKGKLYVLEINCPVGLLPNPRDNSKLPRAAKEAGLSFDQLVGKIIKIALTRYGQKRKYP
jgi:D-alanine-D-alanine ligase